MQLITMQNPGSLLKLAKNYQIQWPKSTTKLTFQLTFPFMETMSDAPHMIRFQYDSRGYATYHLDGHIGNEVFTDHNSFSFTKEAVNDDLFIPGNVRDLSITITITGGDLKFSAVEIFLCK